MAVTRIKMAEDGPDFSRLILGYWKIANWNMSEDELYTYMNQALELGITTFDHADIYGSFSNEETFGKLLSRNPSLRDKMQLVTKCGVVFNCPNRPQYNFHYYDSSKDHIIESVDNSLKNFGTDHIDLLLIHRPDYLMDADEVADAFVRLRETGKVLNFGTSNFTTTQFDLLQSRLFFPLVTNQIKFSVMDMSALDNGMADMCQKTRISPMAYSPLGEGKLFTSDEGSAVRLRSELKKIGEEFNAGIDQVALAWLLKHPAGFVPVLGTGKIERLRAAAVAESIPMSREEWYKIWTASKGHEVP